jgi:hypothetical protein
MKPILAATTLALASLTAQQPFRASDYLPQDYRNFQRIDLKALRETGIWEELRTSALQMMLGAVEKEAGFELEALDRVTQVAVVAQQSEQRRDPDRVMVFEGNTSLGTPDRVANTSAYEAQRIGVFDVMVTETDRAWVFFRPRPEVQVEGALSLLEPLLTGPRNPGGPCPDVLSLQSTRERRLIEVGLDLGERAMRDEVLGKLFADTEWPDGGAPRVLYGRVHDHGDADDPHVMIEVVLRHVDDGDGMAVTVKAHDALIASAKANPKAVAARPMLGES